MFVLCVATIVTAAAAGPAISKAESAAAHTNVKRVFIGPPKTFNQNGNTILSSARSGQAIDFGLTAPENVR
jgi:uncharacterized protein (UPF0333 family)